MLAGCKWNFFGGMEKNQTVFCERCLKQPLRTGKKRTDFPGAKAPGKSVFDAGRGLLDSNGLNLAQGALGQILHRHAGAGGLGGEVLGVHLVEGGKVGNVGEEAGGLDHFVEAHARSLKDGTHVAAALVCLCSDALSDRAGGGVYRDLAGGEDEAAHGVALRVGADGAGGFFGADDVHIDYLTCPE